SISTSSTLKSWPSGVFQTFPASKPLLARMIGPQPAQTLIAKRTMLLTGGLYADVPFTSGRCSEGTILYSFLVRPSKGSFGSSSTGLIIVCPSSLEPPVGATCFQL